MKIRTGFIKCSCGHMISTAHKLIKCCICGRIWKQHGCFYLSRKEARGEEQKIGLLNQKK